MAHGHGGGGFFHEDEVLGKAYDQRLMRWLLSWLRPYRSRGVVAIFGDIFLLIGVSLVLLLLDWRLALVTYVAIPLLLYVTSYMRRIMRESFRAIRIRLARINAYLNENISGMSVVQLFTREDRSFAQFDDLNSDYLQANRDAVRAMSVIFPVVALIRAATIAAIFLVGGWLILGA